MKSVKFNGKKLTLDEFSNVVKETKEFNKPNSDLDSNCNDFNNVSISDSPALISNYTKEQAIKNQTKNVSSSCCFNTGCCYQTNATPSDSCALIDDEIVQKTFI